jgi:hypothetical protein
MKSRRVDTRPSQDVLRPELRHLHGPFEHYTAQVFLNGADDEDMTSDLHEVRRRPADPGVTLIEILVSITLIGTIGMAVIAALFTAVVGSSVQRDHARAHEWLQSATEVLVNDVPWIDCTDLNDPALHADQYELALQGYPDIVPPDWELYSIQVPVDVTYPDNSGSYGAPCNPDENRQKVVIQVQSPDNKIIETVEVVKVP